MSKFDVIGGVVQGAFSLIDELFTSDDEREAAKLKVMQLQQQGRLKEMETQMSAIIMEAKSSDPWTSRARPSFMYVIYVLILSSIPMGILFAVSPETADAVINGYTKWLKAIPSEMWTTFTVGYLGYAGARSWDKHTVAKQEKK